VHPQRDKQAQDGRFAGTHHHDYEAQGDENQECACFKVLATGQKAVPRPQVLGERQADLGDSYEREEKPAYPQTTAGRAEPRM
jgi:hypothetical protein